MPSVNNFLAATAKPRTVADAISAVAVAVATASATAVADGMLPHLLVAA